MAVALSRRRSFDSDSPVTRYWLANCVGFAVAGGDHGVVEEILAEDDPSVPELLVVRSGRHRVKRLPASSVVAVVPSDRTLMVGRKPRAGAAQTRRAGRLAARGGVAGARLLAFLTVHGWRLTRRGVAYASPRVARLARDGGRGTVRLVRSVPWQRYALSARSAMTRQSRDRSASS